MGDDRVQAIELDARLGLGIIAETDQDLDSATAIFEDIEARFDRIENPRQRIPALASFYGVQRPLSAISRHSDRSQHVDSERLLSGKRSFTIPIGYFSIQPVHESPDIPSFIATICPPTTVLLADE